LLGIQIYKRDDNIKIDLRKLSVIVGIGFNGSGYSTVEGFFSTHLQTVWFSNSREFLDQLNNLSTFQERLCSMKLMIRLVLEPLYMT